MQLVEELELINSVGSVMRSVSRKYQTNPPTELISRPPPILNFALLLSLYVDEAVNEII